MIKQFNAYKPKCFDDLVFSNPIVKAKLKGYTEGKKQKSILLWGEPGTGKSVTAKIVANDMIKHEDTLFESQPLVINGYSWSEQTRSKIENVWSYSNVVVIDEVDEIKGKQALLTDLIDQYENIGTFIFTTNKKPTYLLARLVDRCDTIKVDALDTENAFRVVRKILDENKIKRTDDSIKFMIDKLSIKSLSWLQVGILVDDILARS